MRNLNTVMTHAQAVDYFENETMPELRAIEARQDGNPDWPLRCETWNNWTDSLCKDGEISDWQYENWSHPPSCDQKGLIDDIHKHFCRWPGHRRNLRTHDATGMDEQPRGTIK